jgi:hypothetical protein
VLAYRGGGGHCHWALSMRAAISRRLIRTDDQRQFCRLSFQHTVRYFWVRLTTALYFFWLGRHNLC